MRKRSPRVLDDDDPANPTDGEDQSNSDIMDTAPPGATQTQWPWIIKYNNRTRYFCPVSGCPHANLAQAKGWGSLAGVKGHLREHQARRFSGAIPQAFLDAHNLRSCGVCGKIITLRSNGFCPTCHPTRRAAMSEAPTEAPNTANLPSLDEISTTRIRLVKYVPRGARPAWGRLWPKPLLK